MKEKGERGVTRKKKEGEKKKKRRGRRRRRRIGKIGVARASRWTMREAINIVRLDLGSKRLLGLLTNRGSVY